MGQNGSRPERAAEAGRENRRSMILQSIRHSTTVEEDGLLPSEQSASGVRRPQRTRSRSANRLSQLLLPTSRAATEAESSADATRRSGLQRTATRMRNMLGRNNSTRGQGSDARPSLGMLQHRTSYIRAGMNRDGADYYPPRLPSIDVSSTFEHDTFAAADELEQLARSTSRRRSTALSTFSPMRATSNLRQFASSLRRRGGRDPGPSSRRGGNEDQAAMLSRLLSVGGGGYGGYAYRRRRSSVQRSAKSDEYGGYG